MCRAVDSVPAWQTPRLKSHTGSNWKRGCVVKNEFVERLRTMILLVELTKNHNSTCLMISDR